MFDDDLVVLQEYEDDDLSEIMIIVLNYLRIANGLGIHNYDLDECVTYFKMTNKSDDNPIYAIITLTHDGEELLNAYVTGVDSQTTLLVDSKDIVESKFIDIRQAMQLDMKFNVKLMVSMIGLLKYVLKDIRFLRHHQTLNA